MKRKPQGLKTRTKAARGRKVTRHNARSVKSAKKSGRGEDLEKILSLIKTRPGIRPSEINRLLNREQSDGLRNALIKRGLIRKQRDGSAIRYYPV
jgi:predicted transcriptional regulator